MKTVITLIIIALTLQTVNAGYEFKRDRESLEVVKQCMVKYFYAQVSGTGLQGSEYCDRVYDIMERKNLQLIID